MIVLPRAKIASRDESAKLFRRSFLRVANFAACRRLSLMKASLLMRIAGGLSLFTCLGHTAGTFMPIPAEQPAVAAAFQLMQETLVPMPFGRPQSYADIFLGVNLCLMVQLLTYGLMLFVLSSRLTQDRTARLIAMFIALALTATAAISARYFFPLPAFCTALAAIAVALALAVSRRSLAMEHS